MSCRSLATFAGYAPLDPGGSAAEEPGFIAMWRCDRCNKTAADFCTAGPTFPPEGGCPSCAGTYAELGGPCASCNRSWNDSLRFYGYEQLPADPLAEVGPLMNQGLARRALGLLTAYRSRHPHDAHAMAASGELSYYAAMPRRACLLLERALVIGAPNSTRLLLSQCYAAVGDPQRAESSLRVAVAQEPDALVPRLYLCAFYEDRGDPAASLREVDDALRRPFVARDRAELLETRVSALCGLGRAEEAIAAADEACALAPTFYAAKYVRARALGLLGRLDEVRTVLEQIIREAPTDPAAENARAALMKVRELGY